MGARFAGQLAHICNQLLLANFCGFNKIFSPSTCKTIQLPFIAERLCVAQREGSPMTDMMFIIHQDPDIMVANIQTVIS